MTLPRIGVDAWRLRGVRTGMFRYISNVLRHWTTAALEGRVERVTIYTPVEIDARALGLPRVLHVRRLGPDLPMRLWQNVVLGPRADDDVLWCPSFSRPIATRARAIVVTSHEAVSARHPEMYGAGQKYVYNRLYAWSARRSTLAIAGSENARDDIASSWGVPVARLRVVYNGAADVFRPDADEHAVKEGRARLLGSDAPYFLFVGKLTGRRSVPLLLDAFVEFKRRSPSGHLLAIVGANPKNVDVSGMAEARGVAAEVRHLGWIPDDDLQLLYNGADAYVSSAVYEPVSIPVMEAQAVGVPVIAVDCPGVREATGGEALLTSAPDPREMAEAMALLANDPGLRRTLADRGRAYAVRFSWQKTSRETLDVLLEAARISTAASAGGR